MPPKIRINLYKKRGPLDVIGWMLGVQQRSGITHANLQVDDTCYTTGARFHPLKGWVFGAARAEKYNRGRAYYGCEFVSPLTETEIDTLLAVCDQLDGQPYGLGKVLKLAAIGNLRADFICQLGAVELTCRNPFCSESVVFLCWKIGRMVCQWLCRREPSVCSPHDLYLEAERGVILRIAERVGVVF